MNSETPPFAVRTYGWVIDRPRHSTPGTKEHDTMLILNVDGLGHFRNSSGHTLVQPSMVCLISPDDPGVFFSDPDRPYVHAYCRFGGRYAQDLAAKIVDQRGSVFFPVENMSQFVHFLSPLPPQGRREFPADMGDLELGLAQVLVALLSKPSPVKGSGITRHAVMQYLEMNMDQKLELDEMAEYFQMTKPALCRAGKKVLGQTIVSASHHMRIGFARQLLETSAMNVSEVAHRVGFEDPYYFSRVFKAAMGISPKQWQMKQEKQPVTVTETLSNDLVQLS